MGQIKIIEGTNSPTKAMSGEEDSVRNCVTQKAADQVQSLRAQCAELQILVKQKENIIRSCSQIFVECA